MKSLKFKNMKDKVKKRKHQKLKNKDNRTQKKSLENQVIFCLNFLEKHFKKLNDISAYNSNCEKPAKN